MVQVVAHVCSPSTQVGGAGRAMSVRRSGLYDELQTGLGYIETLHRRRRERGLQLPLLCTEVLSEEGGTWILLPHLTGGMVAGRG